MLGSVSALQETLSTCGDTELTLTLAGGAGEPVKENNYDYTKLRSYRYVKVNE